MKKIVLIIVVLILLALDLAALHDILKGEPDPYAEYGMLVVSVIVFGFLIVKWQTGKSSVKHHRNS